MRETNFENEAQKREYYLSRLRGNDASNDLVKNITERIYDQLKNDLLFEAFILKLEELGKIGLALYKSFYTFNLFMFHQRESRKIFEYPENMPLAYMKMLIKGDFSFENFVPDLSSESLLESEKDIEE